MTTPIKNNKTKTMRNNYSNGTRVVFILTYERYTGRMYVFSNKNYLFPIEILKKK